MGCGFCATGQMGLESNLTEGEIAAQVVWARREAARLPDTTPQRLSNVVFMGMGDRWRTIERYAARSTGSPTPRVSDGRPAHHGLDGGPRAGIKRLGQDHPQVGLAVSFHAADDELRDDLVPPNRLYPLARLEAAMAAWRDRTHRAPLDRVGDDRRRKRRR